MTYFRILVLSSATITMFVPPTRTVSHIGCATMTSMIVPVIMDTTNRNGKLNASHTTQPLLRATIALFVLPTRTVSHNERAMIASMIVPAIMDF
jgi:hypothetical protein